LELRLELEQPQVQLELQERLERLALLVQLEFQELQMQQELLEQLELVQIAYLELLLRLGFELELMEQLEQLDLLEPALRQLKLGQSLRHNLEFQELVQQHFVPLQNLAKRFVGELVQLELGSKSHSLQLGHHLDLIGQEVRRYRIAELALELQIQVQRDLLVQLARVMELELEQFQVERQRGFLAQQLVLVLQPELVRQPELVLRPELVLQQVLELRLQVHLPKFLAFLLMQQELRQFAQVVVLELELLALLG
jgi:hypothetical protein